MIRPRPLLPLPRFGDDWRQRWLVIVGPRGGWSNLHRVYAVDWDDDDQIAGFGVTACGLLGRLQMPGLSSRLGRPRCAQCCTAANVPQGAGAPFNEGIDA